jgi:hypothetical protein
LLVPLVPLAQLIASPSVSPMIQNRQVKVRCFGPLENCETNKASMYHMYVRMFIMFIFRGWSTASTAQHSTSYRTKTQGMNKVNTTHSSLNMVITVRTHLSSKWWIPVVMNICSLNTQANRTAPYIPLPFHKIRPIYPRKHSAQVYN